jgi:hypothetical protein
MAQYPKPSGSSGTFNNGNFNNNQSGGLTIAEGLKYFVSYPKTQTPSTITADNFTTTGNLDVAGDSAFGGDVDFLGGVTITGGIVFKDDVEVQGTTTLDDTLLCLKDVTIDGELTVTNNVILEPNALTPTTAPYLELTNGVVNEYAHFYLDPQSGFDMTLYTNQNPGGGLTIRGANTQSFTMNPYAVQDGTGCQFQNPVDMNGNSLSGLLNVYSDNSTITFRDSAVNQMLILSNTGHTSYENINMNYNQLSNVNQINFGGNSCSIQNSNTFNPSVLAIANNSPYANAGQIYFQMLNSGGVAFSPMSINSSNVSYGVDINMGGHNITSCGSINSSAGSYVTTTTPPVNDNTTKIATTAFVQNACPIYTTTSATNTFGGSIMTPTSLDITTIQDNGYVTFTSSEFNIQLTQAQNTLAYITFATKPWPSFPPPAQNYYINGLCTSVAGLATVIVVNFSGTGPYYMSMYLQTGSLNTVGTFYTINLGTMQAFKT